MRQHETLAESLAHQNLPFLTLVENSPGTRLPGYMPLIQVLFNYFKIPRTMPFAELFVTGHDVEPVESPGLTMEAFGLEQDEGEFDLVLEVAEGRRCWARFKYGADLFDRSTIVRLTGALSESFGEHRGRSGSGGFPFAIARRDGTRRMVEGWNETQCRLSRGCLCSRVLRDPGDAGSGPHGRDLRRRASDLCGTEPVGKFAGPLSEGTGRGT